MKSPDSRSILRVYLVFVFLFVVGFLLFIGFAISAPLWLTLLLALGAGVGYALFMTYWVKTHRRQR